MITKQIFTAALLAVVLASAGCSAVSATGDAVQGVGEGAGHIVSETGRAIERGAERTRREF